MEARARDSEQREGIVGRGDSRREASLVAAIRVLCRGRWKNERECCSVFVLCRGRLFSQAQSRFFLGGIVLWVAAIRALCRPVCALDSQTITELPAPRRKSTNATTKRNRSYDQSAPHILSSLEIWHRRAFRIKFNNFLYGKARRSARHTRVARRQTNIDLKQIVLASFRRIYKSIGFRADPKLQRYTIGFFV